MTHREFVDRYRVPLASFGVIKETNQERVEQARTLMNLDDHDVVLGQHKVSDEQMSYIYYAYQ